MGQAKQIVLVWNAPTYRYFTLCDATHPTLVIFETGCRHECRHVPLIFCSLIYCFSNSLRTDQNLWIPSSCCRRREICWMIFCCSWHFLSSSAWHKERDETLTFLWEWQSTTSTCRNFDVAVTRGWNGIMNDNRQSGRVSQRCCNGRLSIPVANIRLKNDCITFYHRSSEKKRRLQWKPTYSLPVRVGGDPAWFS